MASVDVRNMTRRPTPRFAYEEIAAKLLPKWDVSLVYVGETRATQINRALRKKSYAPNVLSYETGNRSGEVLVCLSVAKRQAPSYGMSYRDFVAYLFIHGLLHLKGHPHGPTMERLERDLMTRFINVPRTLPHAPTHIDRHRHRHSSDEGRRRRRGA